jgi:hypothetical protein
MSFSYAFILLVRQFRLLVGVILTLPSVLATTHVGTDEDFFSVLAKRRFFAGGLTLAIFSYPCNFCFSLA